MNNTGKIYASIGDNMAILIQWLSTFFAAYVVGFIREWRLALVLVGLTPLLGMASGIFSKVTTYGIACYVQRMQFLE